VPLPVVTLGQGLGATPLSLLLPPPLGEDEPPLELLLLPPLLPSSGEEQEKVNARQARWLP